MDNLSSKSAAEELQEAFLSFHSHGIHFFQFTLSDVFRRIESSPAVERQNTARDEVGKIITQAESQLDSRSAPDGNVR